MNNEMKIKKKCKFAKTSSLSTRAARVLALHIRTRAAHDAGSVTIAVVRDDTLAMEHAAIHGGTRA